MDVHHSDNKKKFSQKIYRIIRWADENFPLVCVLNSNTTLLNTFKRRNDKKGLDYLDYIIAAGRKVELLPVKYSNFTRLKQFYQKCLKNRMGGWLFGFLTYDLKSETENLLSENQDNINMPPMHFFIPEYLFIVKNNTIEVVTGEKNFDLDKEILKPENRSQDLENKKPVLREANTNFRNSITKGKKTKINLKSRISKSDYIGKVSKIKEHIQRGDIYELNFCQEFYAEDVSINPLDTWFRMNEISPMPFSCYYKLRDKYLLCGSPERFLKKEGRRIFSQPIKGTIRRGRNKKEDSRFVKKLRSSKKERSENVMIVDLVRNDLSRVSDNGSVKVDELFGIYTYRNLHQMISTVSGELDKKIHFLDAIKSCFPMGSMTGAPKVKAMELIEKYEPVKRGLFSGTVGYFSPGENFDFNVVIRSILYNKKNRYISVMAGSAITASCDPEKEYEECLLKAGPMRKALEQS